MTGAACYRISGLEGSRLVSVAVDREAVWSHMTHGTHSAYIHLRCRCDSCREAEAAYQRSYRENGYTIEGPHTPMSKRDQKAVIAAINDADALLARVDVLEAELAKKPTWVEHICGRSHRWRSEDKSTRCPVCGTSTFKEAAELSHSTPVPTTSTMEGTA